VLDAAQILRQSLQSTRLDSYAAQVAQSTHVAETGKALGLVLEVMEDPVAQLQDSMEELSGQFEEKAMKEVGQRKLGKARGRMTAYARAVEKWTAVFKDLPNGETVDRLLKQLKQSKSVAPSPRELLKLLARLSSDPSHQFALLDILEQAFAEAAQQGREAQRNGELKELAEQAKKLLDAEKGAEVKAGVNLAEEVNARAKTSEEMQGLRDLYRSEVLGFTKPQDCFRSLLASRGAGRLSEALDFLTKGCSLDMQSASPSRSPEELRRITLDLQSVSVLRSMLEKCDAVVAKMLAEFAETSLLNGEQLAGKIVDFTEMPFVNAQDVAGLLQSCGFAQLLAKLYFTTRLTEMFRGLSARLFEDGADRFRLIDAAQEHLDGLVSLQEEAEKKAKDEKDKEAAA